MKIYNTCIVKVLEKWAELFNIDVVDNLTTCSPKNVELYPKKGAAKHYMQIMKHLNAV